MRVKLRSINSLIRNGIISGVPSTGSYTTVKSGAIISSLMVGKFGDYITLHPYIYIGEAYQWEDDDGWCYSEEWFGLEPTCIGGE